MSVVVVDQLPDVLLIILEKMLDVHLLEDEQRRHCSCCVE